MTDKDVELFEKMYREVNLSGPRRYNNEADEKSILFPNASREEIEENLMDMCFKEF